MKKAHKPLPLDSETGYRLSCVSSFGTSIEKLFSSKLHRLGARFRLHPKDVIGHPDVVNRSAKVAIFIDGCFWHGHDGCFNLPLNNRTYWQNKINRNHERRLLVRNILQTEGWLVLEFWECEIRRFPDIVAMVAYKALRSRQGIPPRA